MNLKLNGKSRYGGCFQQRIGLRNRTSTGSGRSFDFYRQAVLKKILKVPLSNYGKKPECRF